MNHIARLRRIRGLNQSELADMVNVSQAHISRLENGDEGPPLSLFREIATALKVSLPDLFADERTREEWELMDAIRRLPAGRRRGWIDTAKLAAQDRELPSDETSQTDHPTDFLTLPKTLDPSHPPKPTTGT